MSARIAINLDLFKLITANGSPITSQQLAAKSGGEELLISKKCTTQNLGHLELILTSSRHAAFGRSWICSRGWRANLGADSGDTRHGHG